jgi:Flp pilus assembly protein TadG
VQAPVFSIHRCGPTRPMVQRAGVAAVEFAVIAPLLFLVVLGIIEFGRAMMTLEVLNNAARSGCRVGVLSGSDNNAINAAVTNSLAAGSMSGATTTVQVNGVQADASTAVTGDTITVSISISANSVSWLPVSQFLSGRTLSGAVSMRRE